MDTRDYVLRLPKDVTVVEACETVGCENWLYGWDSVLDESTPGGRDAAAWIRSGASGRTYRELGGGDVAVFRFEPHQRCFAEHRTRPARWLVAAGPGQTIRHAGMHGWIDDLDDHAGRLAEQLAKG